MESKATKVGNRTHLWILNEDGKVEIKEVKEDWDCHENHWDYAWDTDKRGYIFGGIQVCCHCCWTKSLLNKVEKAADKCGIALLYHMGPVRQESEELSYN